MLRQYFDKYSRGALILIIGVYAIIRSSSYDIGSIAKMGAGFYPALVGILLFLVGLALIFKSSPTGYDDDDVIHPVDWRGWFFILAGIIAFIIGIRYFGLLPASFAVVFISSFADRTNKIKGVLVLSTVVTVISVVVFWWALGVQLPLLKLG